MTRTLLAVASLLALLVPPAGAQAIVEPREGARLGPRIRVVADAPPGTATTIFSIDGVEIARFHGAGRHTRERTLSRAGVRRLLVRAFAPDGHLLGSAERTLRIVDDLAPPSVRGRVRLYPGRLGGVRLNERTAAMLANASRWLRERGEPCPAHRAGTRWITQGSYSRSVSASAGTHDRGGALDLSVAGLTSRQRHALVRALREAGFAAWLRTRPTFDLDHVHAIAVGDPDLPAAARRQVRDYLEGRDGLASHARDPHGGPIVRPWMRGAGLIGGLPD